MINFYCVKDNVILITAQGSSRRNKIKNDLIWDINSFLADRFEMYAISECHSPPTSAYYIPISKNSKKYLTLQKLDDMFFSCKMLSDEEIEYYRSIMDPYRKIDDEIFKEMCCFENIDIEYIASEFDSFDKDFLPTTLSIRQARSLFPVYVSLFGAKEVKIVVNRSDLLNPIKEIIEKYCVKKLDTLGFHHRINA